MKIERITMDTFELIKDTLAHNLDIDPNTVTVNSTLESLGIDSLDMVELICDIEDKLNIEFGEPEGLKTIGDIINYIDTLSRAHE